MTLPRNALVLAGVTALGGLSTVGYALHTMPALHDYRFVVLLVLALITARLKVQLPGLTGNMAVNLPFLLIAVAQLSMFEALLVVLPACAVQCFPAGGGKLKPVQLIFNLSTKAVAVAVASLLGAQLTLLGAAGFFLAETVPVAGIIRATEGGSLPSLWCRIAHYYFPFFVLSAGLVSIAASTGSQLGWQLPLVGLPTLYAIYRSYQSYFRVPTVELSSSAEA